MAESTREIGNGPALIIMEPEPMERAVDALREQVVRALAAAAEHGGVDQIEIRAPVATWEAVARELGWGEEPWT